MPPSHSQIPPSPPSSPSPTPPHSPSSSPSSYLLLLKSSVATTKVYPSGALPLSIASSGSGRRKNPGYSVPSILSAVFRLRRFQRSLILAFVLAVIVFTRFSPSFIPFSRYDSQPDEAAAILGVTTPEEREMWLEDMRACRRFDAAARRPPGSHRIGAGPLNLTVDDLRIEYADPSFAYVPPYGLQSDGDSDVDEEPAEQLSAPSAPVAPRQSWLSWLGLIPDCTSDKTATGNEERPLNASSGANRTDAYGAFPIPVSKHHLAQGKKIPSVIHFILFAKWPKKPPQDDPVAQPQESVVVPVPADESTVASAAELPEAGAPVGNERVFDDSTAVDDAAPTLRRRSTQDNSVDPARRPDPRYLCSLESALRHNPTHQVHLHADNAAAFFAPDSALLRWRESLPASIRDRLHVSDLDWDTPMRYTPLEQWYRDKRYEQSHWPQQNLGNALRLALLWHHGGVYLDMDIISVNPVGGIGRTVAKQDSITFNNAFFSFPARDEFVWNMMTEFVNEYDGNAWGKNGPLMVTRTFRRTCVENRQQNIETCHDLGTAPPERFYPINFNSREFIFRPYYYSCHQLARMAERSIGFHWWKKGLDEYDTPLQTTSMLGHVMSLHCPSLLETVGPEGMGFSTSQPKVPKAES